MGLQRKAVGTTTVVLSVIIVILIGLLAIVVAVPQSVIRPVTTTTTQTTTIITRESYTTTTTELLINSSMTYSSCYVDPMGDGTYLRITSDLNRQPLSNISVFASPIANGTCYGHGSPAAYSTNASGWVSVGALEGGAYFEVLLEYAARSYSFSIPQVSLDVTYATLSVPSGRLGITVCYHSSCATYNQTAILS